jgi:hypothetical protein
VRIIHDRRGTVDVDEFLARPLFAHLATDSDEGARESPVWFLWEDGAIWIIGSRRDDSFLARIERDPRCALGVVDFNPHDGLIHHVGMRGRASVERFDPERARRLLRRYLGGPEEAWDARFRTTLERPRDEDAALVRFDPDTVVARDVSYEPATTDER